MVLSKAARRDDLDAAIEALKEQVTQQLKGLQRIRKKLQETEIRIYGIPDKEIKLNQKYAKGRKPDKELLQKVKLYLVDPAKMIRDDKTVKLARAKFLRKGQMKRPEQSQASGDIAESLNTGEAPTGMVVTIGEDGLPVDKNEEDDVEAPDQGEQGEGHESGLAEPRADADEGMDPDAGSDADDAAAEGEGRSSQQDIHASTTNISQPGDAGDDDDGEGGLTAADSSGNLIVKKKRAVSKSPRKGKRKGPSDLVELIEFGPSKKLGGKLVVTEKVAIPQEIADYVAATFEDGFDALTPA